jgi:hypothetical protein
MVCTSQLVTLKKKVMNPQSVVILKEGLKMSRFFSFQCISHGDMQNILQWKSCLRWESKLVLGSYLFGWLKPLVLLSILVTWNWIKIGFDFCSQNHFQVLKVNLVLELEPKPNFINWKFWNFLINFFGKKWSRIGG